MKNNDIYDRLRAKIREWASTKEGGENKWVKYLLLLPDFLHLLCSLVLDPEVPPKQKAILGVVIAYIISPIDLIPEGIVGPVGYVDDIALAAYAINQLVNEVDKSIVLKHWKGDADLLDTLQNILATADGMLGSGLWNKIKNFGKQEG